MSEHSPKTQALMAYDAEALSQAGQRRIEHHLEACETCQRELLAIQTYAELATEIRSAEIPRLDYGRMELALRREARDQAKGSKRSVAWALLALAAAVLLGVVGLRQRGVDSPQASRLPERAPETQLAHADTLPVDSSVAPQEQPLEGELTAVAGVVRIANAQANLGDVLHEGDVLETGVASGLHGRLASGTGFALAPDSRLALSRVRPSGIVLSLQHGAVSNAVLTGTVYQVDAGAYRVVVRGTRFSVARDGAEVRVSLAEGTVAIERGDATLEVLHAPAEWASPGAETAATDTPGVDSASVERPIGLDMELRWPSLTLPPFPRVVAWEVEGARFPADALVALRAPEGELTLQAFDARGRAREVHLEMLPEGLTLTEAMLPRIRVGTTQGELSPEAIRTVVRSRQAALRRCYERVLRRQGDPSLTQAAYSLRVDVGVHGDVRGVELTASGGEAHPALRDCITHEALGWIFPAPGGGPVSFELPLNLSAR